MMTIPDNDDALSISDSEHQDEVDAYFDADPEAAFRQAWHEAMTGQTYPISSLCEDLDRFPPSLAGEG